MLLLFACLYVVEFRVFCGRVWLVLCVGVSVAVVCGSCWFVLLLLLKVLVVACVARLFVLWCFMIVCRFGCCVLC